MQLPPRRTAWVRRPLMTTIAAFVMGGALLGNVPASRVVSADQIAQKQGERGQLNLTIAQLQQQIGNAQDQEAQLQQIIDQLNTQVAQAEGAVTATQDRLASVGRELSDAQDRLQATQDRLAANRLVLAREMVVSYKLGSEATALGAVFGSGDFNEGWQRLIAIRRISASEDRLVQSVEDERSAITATVAQIADRKAQQREALRQLNAQVDDLQGSVASRTNAQALLVQLQQQDTVRLQLAEQSARELDAEIAQLQAEAAAAAAVAAMARANHAGGNGQFIWPENGPITQGFGCTPYPFEPYDPSCPSRHFHTGIDIGAPEGTRVGAADAGIAHVYSSPYGYGNYVILDHGNGFVSVYGHLASFAVSDGQTVSRGQTIGYEGSTGNSTGPHLHFEIRDNNQPVNPLGYLP